MIAAPSIYVRTLSGFATGPQSAIPIGGIVTGLSLPAASCAAAQKVSTQGRSSTSKDQALRGWRKTSM
jgi:hypothetical protein